MLYENIEQNVINSDDNRVIIEIESAIVANPEN